MRAFKIALPLAACAVAVAVFLAAGSSGASPKQTTVDQATNAELVSNIALLRRAETDNDQIPARYAPVADKAAAESGFTPEVIRHITNVGDLSLYLAAGPLKGVPTACVVTLQPNGGISSTCNNAGETLKGALVGADAGQDGETTVFQVVPDGSNSPLKVDGKAVTANGNVTVGTARAGTPLTFIADGKTIQSVVAGETGG